MYMNDHAGHLVLVFPPITTIYLLMLVPELLEPSISLLEEDMVRGIKRGIRWEEIVNRWPFRKGLIMVGPLGYIYTIFGLEASLAGLPQSGWVGGAISSASSGLGEFACGVLRTQIVLQSVMKSL
jgi:hypothetical protein